MSETLAAELDAATRVAARLRLGEIEPEILKLAHHTTVRLAPTTIVARIRARDSSHSAKLTRELTIARYLASRGAPTVRPVSMVEPGPYFESGCAITLWELAVGNAAETEADALVAARALRQVHRALRDLPFAVPSFTVAFDSCERILSNAAEAPGLGSADRGFLRQLYAQLRQELDRRELNCRPLHGDAHLGNVLVSSAGATWMDLDDVCMGPLEWDVASLPPDAWSEFDDIDRDLVELLAALRSLCVAAWCWADFERNADAREAAIDHLDSLKARFSQAR